MKKKLFSIIIIVFNLSTIVFSQNVTEENPLLKPVTPPSPTVSSLMKYNEVGVNYYNGVPQIEIPIFSTPTKNKELPINILLKYHPTGIQITNTASWAGLGWDLEANGVISKTIRGGFNDKNPQKGILSPQNPFYDTFYDTNGEFYSYGIQYEKYDFLWNVQEKGKYDTEYDLYQYSFANNNGSFYINNQNEIILLKNDTKIKISYNDQEDSFTIIDENGIKFYFSDKEITSEYKLNSYLPRGNDDNIVYPITEQDPQYVSAYQLTNIKNINDFILVSYEYNAVTEIIENRTETRNYISHFSGIPAAKLLYCHLDPRNSSVADEIFVLKRNLDNTLPIYQQNSITTTITTKKISKINIEGIAKILIEGEMGRLDLNPEAKRLKTISIFNWNNKLIKNIELDHSYEGEENRLVLNNVIEYNNSLNQSLTTNLFYDRIGLLPNKFSQKKDAWGYFNNSSGGSVLSINKKVNPDYCTVGVLQKMKIPSGGCYIFDFESNDYSYISDTPLTEFDNPKNEQPDSRYREYTINQLPESNFLAFNLKNDQDINPIIETTFSSYILPENKKAYFFKIIPIEYTEPIPDPNAPIQSTIQLYEIPVNDIVIDSTRQVKSIKLQEINPDLTSNYFYGSIPLRKGAYAIEFLEDGTETLSTQNIKYKLTINFKKLTDEYKSSLGGGLRIKNIAYFNNGDTNQNYYKDLINSPFLNHGTPETELKYSYTFHNDNTRSSGSLAFLKPIFNYNVNKSSLASCNKVNPQLSYTPVLFNYDIVTDFNNLSPLKTQGADIGYKNITIERIEKKLNIVEDGLFNKYIPIDIPNGKMEMIYTSPIDFPTPNYAFEYPFRYSPNYDYKKGLLTDSKTYDINNILLNHTSNSYSIEEGYEILGIKTFYASDCPFLKLWGNYASYLDGISNGSLYNCGIDLLYVIDFDVLRNYFGWVKLESKTIKSYFNNQILEETEYFTYNNSNKKISSQTKTNSTLESVETNYFYAEDLNNLLMIDKNMIGIPLKTETKKNSNLISTQETVYKDWGNGLLAPWIIKTSKGDRPLEDRVTYNELDNSGTPLEIQQVGGSPVSYIWGYNKTQPVAKIENLAYASIPQTHLDAIETASNNNDEASLITALNALRNDQALQNAMVTTYTYIPLVGISSVTDPKGNTTTYHYDSFNRLEFVKDHQGNIISENKYHYRTQN